MTQVDSLYRTMTGLLEERLGDQKDAYAFPPPVFVAMEGRFVKLDLEAQSLAAQFPICSSDLNPFGTVQGGMIAAAVDNTLGPLSMLVAPPSVTRQLEMKYSRPVTLEMGQMIVHARLVERRARKLYFRADVRSPSGERLARSKAIHWIVDQEWGKSKG